MIEECDMGRKRGTNGSRIRAEHAVIDQSLTWFVVHTLPLREAAAAEEFGTLAMDWWLPRYRVTVVRRGRKIDTQAIFFASYLFVGLDRDRHAGRWTEPLFDSRHVIDVLGRARRWRSRARSCRPCPIGSRVSTRRTGRSGAGRPRCFRWASCAGS
ncbi:hypothetical protein CTI14_12195 [Methylobacterium radiotolerans]|nr:hypothetical protein CTI14_12195 [Methylobacterium radiotolerans]